MKNHIKKGWGFDVGCNFARAVSDTPIDLAPAEFAKPRHVIGYIAENPASSLGFLKYGTNGKVRVHVVREAIGESAEPVKHESKAQPGLFFWAEPNGGGAGAVESFGVVSQVTGFPATEAHDDWFANFKDADEIAQRLARGENVT